MGITHTRAPGFWRERWPNDWRSHGHGGRAVGAGRVGSSSLSSLTLLLVQCLSIIVPGTASPAPCQPLRVLSFTSNSRKPLHRDSGDTGPLATDSSCETSQVLAKSSENDNRFKPGPNLEKNQCRWEQNFKARIRINIQEYHSREDC